MEYSKRAMDIVDILLNRDSFISIAKLADELNMSKRTIFRDMEEIETLISEQGMQLLRKAKSGIKIETSENQKEALKQFLVRHKTVHFTQEERLNQIIIELLRSREPKKFFYFSTLLNVSDATISYDMDKVEPWFKERSITLVRKPGYGVFLKGKEIDFRKAIVDFLYQNYEHQDLVSLIDNTSNFVETVMDREISMKVSRILSQYEDFLANRLTDQSYMGLMIHLSIAVQRILRGESIVMNPEVLTPLKSDELFKMARNIGNDIEKVFGIRFPEDELGYITMHLKGSKLKTGALIDQQDLIISNFELSRLASTMIQKFKELSGYDLREDEKLLIGLVSHLRPALTRIKLSLDIRNPLLEKIEEMYPEIFNMSSITGELIAKQFNVVIPREEVGYIAMHFGAAIERYVKLQNIEKRIKTGVVCSSGIGTSSLLYSRLVKLFPRLEVVGQFSKEDVFSDKMTQNELELLITTINLDKSKLPSIQVNPLLMSEDIERIKQVISILSSNVRPYKQQSERVKNTESPVNDVERVKRIHGLTDSFLVLENSFKLYQHVKAKNIEALIKLISETLTDEYKKRKQLQNVLMEREKLGSTVLQGEGVALIHGKAAIIKALSFTIWRLDKPMTVKAGKRIETITSAVVMLIPEDVSKEQIEVMSVLSKSLIEEIAFVEIIKKADEVALFDYVKMIMHKWLSKQLKAGGLV